MQPIRTVSEIDFEFTVFLQEPFLCQQISPKVKELKMLGMNVLEISKQLGIDWHTVSKAAEWEAGDGDYFLVE